ncbi:DUF3302 domain-containing protein [methanotrophic endosymbiont of Bathymodiolus puteoserpentis (Logatchev)]|jgi:hypothetical protein|uniref:DUF3302 domain-containing protein n=1 Tax=methanotrophic endosymbiont of Bathymodiolus puteoserpentis (Logatchev) TaxID=343235 RepID=UPI00157B2F1E|nr:DUF3302 domain-containing protein [methanotrophic endosymbiont of Bathymodiolus puteoserpentis (Logatchev)]
MTGLDLFALFVLLILFATTIAAWVILGMLPGRIARSRNHPQSDAIKICGWIGALTMGIFSPIAYIWAYTKPQAKTTEIIHQESEV